MDRIRIQRTWIRNAKIYNLVKLNFVLRKQEEDPGQYCSCDAYVKQEQNVLPIRIYLEVGSSFCRQLHDVDRARSEHT
jgi:hypothetical protein